MIRSWIFFTVLSSFLLAAEKSAIPSSVLLTGALLSIVLFFWGVYKTVKTQALIYMLALLPFLIMLTWMFVI